MELKEFIQTLVDNKALENQKIDGFTDYVDASLLSPTREYRNTVKEAMEDYERSLAGYGESGEALAQGHLNGGGYAAHLNRLANVTLHEAEKEARAEEGEAFEGLRKGYGEYLEQKDSEDSKLVSKIMKELAEIDGVSYTSAYDYAVMRGLDKERAKLLAKEAETLRMNEYRQQVLRQMALYYMKYDAARKYALASGFSEEEAHKMAIAAQALYDDGQNRDFTYYD